jgi:hypothetical protein
MSRKHTITSVASRLDTLILHLRGERVILDSDLASIYGVTTKRLNEQVRRNSSRFPEDFCFRLTQREFQEFRLQRTTAALNSSNMRSQIATALKRNVRFLPYAFTEHGAIMAANVLNSRRAVKMSVFVVRAFIKMRRVLMATSEMTKTLQELEDKLTKRLDTHEHGIFYLLEEIRKLMDPPPLHEKKKRPIGFCRDDS